MFSPVLDIILPIFGLLMMGFISARVGWFGQSSVKGLTRFVFDFAVPILLLSTIAKANLPDVIPWGYVFSYYLGTIIVLILGLFFSRVIRRGTFSEQVISAFSGSFSNTVLLGIPIVILTFGDDAVLPLFIIIGTHGVFMVPLFTILLELGQNENEQLKKIFFRTVNGLLINPLVIGLVCGLILNFLEINLWKPLDEMAKLLSSSVTACSLFALGASLAYFRNNIPWKEVPIIVFLKTIIHPLIIWVMATFVFGIDEKIWIYVLILLAAQPTGVNPFLFASRYNVGKSVSSGSAFLSTIVSIFTLSFLLSFLT